MNEEQRKVVNEALWWFGIDTTTDDCDVCEDGSVYHGLTMILPKGSIEVDESIMLVEPTDGDYTITPGGRLGGMSAVGQIGGKFVGLFNCDDDAVRAIRFRCNSELFWPNIWLVSDHGNWMLYVGESA